MVCMVCLIIVFSIVGMGPGSKLGGGIDYLGHAGGAITGLVWGLAFFPRVHNEYSKKVKLWGMCGTATFFILFTLLFYLTEPNA